MSQPWRTPLVLPITSIEESLVDAISGQLTIDAIAARTLSDIDYASYNDAIRSFFELLWWHDQVVFATTQPHHQK